jgi:predicted nuclease of predicted toxin-antitoxin system
VRLLLDEDINPETAVIGRGLGLDVQSIHEIGRRGLPDDEQLDHATREGLAFVTRNRDDFVRLARAAYETGRACAVVVIIPFTFPNRDAARMAHALKRWHDRHAGSASSGWVDFL